MPVNNKTYLSTFGMRFNKDDYNVDTKLKYTSLQYQRLEDKSHETLSLNTIIVRDFMRFE